MNNRYILLVLMLSLFVGIEDQSLAETVTTKKQSSSQLQIDPEFNPDLGTYYYDVYWQKMRVGKATITLRRENDLYKVIVYAKTSSAVKLLYKAKYRGEVKMEASPTKPIQANIKETTGKKHKDITIRFPQEDQVEATEVQSIGGKKTSIEERAFSSETFILDPFSTVFLVRHLDWHVSMAEVFDIFTGKKQYELKLLCHSSTTLEIAGKKREAWVIIPHVTSLEGDKRETKSEFKVYLSRDKHKEILKIEGAPRIGRVVARIRKFEPLPLSN